MNPSPETASNGHLLGAGWREDAEATIAALRGVQPDWLVVDHYGIDNQWEAVLKDHCRRLMVIDDLADRRHDCDLLLDQNLVNGYETRYTELVPSPCALLLGPKYALLQPEYAELHPRTPPRLGPVTRILIYFGGVDRLNLTGLAIDAIADLNCDALTVDVVTNPAGPHAACIRSMVAGLPWIRLHERLQSLAPLMLKADLAIGAGGTTTWERCCMGLPSLVVTIAENQVAGAEELNRQGAVWWLGCGPRTSRKDINEAVKERLTTPDELRRCSVTCRELVDGSGTERVAENLLLGDRSSLKARPACLLDESLLLTWANNPVVRANGFHPEAITAEGHRRWFYERLRRPESSNIYIVVTEKDSPIGQVRFEIDNGEWEIHYSIAAEARHRGLGAVMLSEAMRVHRISVGSASVKGRVRTGNQASIRIFEKLRFTVSEVNGHELIYRRSL